MPDWLRRLIRKIAALKESAQRSAVFLDDMSARTGEESAAALRWILAYGWVTRSEKAKILLDTAMDALASRQWPEAHLSEMYLAAESMDDALLTAVLPFPGVADNDTGEEPLPVPSYTSDRPLTLGERKSVASRPSRRLIGLAVMDPHPDVIEKLLVNPKLTEDDVVYIAARRPTVGAVLETVARHPKWRIRPRVARAIIYNPHTPPAVAVGLVHLLPRGDVVKLEDDPKVPKTVRRFARELNALTPADLPSS